MSFNIQHARENDIELIRLVDEESGTSIAILPQYGATLHEFRVHQKNGQAFNVIDNYKDLADLKADLSRSFKGSKLSPFPCRIPDGKYKFGSKEYQLEHLFGDGTAIHGLLYNKPFSVQQEMADATSGGILLSYSYKKDDSGYPFEYDCQVKYILHPSSELEVITTVINTDKVTIPIADGWHPYFQLAGRVDDWQMQFHASAIVEFDQRLVPTGALGKYEVFEMPRAINDTFLDNCFVVKPEMAGAACELFNPANGLRVSFFPDATYPYLQVYTPATRTSIAVENLSGAPDCFNNKMGLIQLEPGQSQIFTVRYKVSVE